MLITKPAYFDSFRCIAGACSDSCCKEWDVLVDPAAACLYRSLPGALGDRLREVLYTEEDQTYLSIIDGRCPMWRQDGLCRIQAELGEGALCHTCREFPRLTHDYGDFVEKGLELSCPEAARFILRAPWEPAVCEECPGGEEPGYDEEAMGSLKASRQVMLSILKDQGQNPAEALALALLYGYQAQSELDGAPIAPFHPDTAMDTLRQLSKPGSIGQILAFYQELEILTPQWHQRLTQFAAPVFPEQVRNLARYFVERYWLQAVSDYDLVCRVKLMVISCLVICALGGSFEETAQLYSKEIENNADNVDALLDAAYSGSAFTDDKLLGLLLDVRES